MTSCSTPTAEKGRASAVRSATHDECSKTSASAATKASRGMRLSAVRLVVTGKEASPTACGPQSIPPGGLYRAEVPERHYGRRQTRHRDTLWRRPAERWVGEEWCC